MLSRSSHSPRKDAPTSPWRKLLVRSRSLEGVSSDENEDGKKSQQRRRTSLKMKKDKTTTTKQHQASSGTWGWLLTPPTRLVGNPLQRTATPAKQRLFSSNRPSNLTMFLLRLEEHLPRYCKLLSDASLQHCQEAAEILDSSVATTSPQHSPSMSDSSTHFFRHPPKHINSEHAMALEGEWETYVSPLLLFTGAEALYGQMEMTRLTHLYKTIQSDLHIVKERLCDPWLTTSCSASVTLNSSRSLAHQAATSVALTLDGIQTYITIKRQLVDMQTTLFCESRETLLETCRRELLLLLLPLCKDNADDCGQAVAPMIDSLIHEMKAWIALLETASHLEQCQ